MLPLKRVENCKWKGTSPPTVVGVRKLVFGLPQALSEDRSVLQAMHPQCTNYTLQKIRQMAGQRTSFSY